MKRRRRNRTNSVQTEHLETRALLSSISVNSLADNRIVNNQTTLREAIDQANDGDVIEFAVQGTVNMDLGQFVITKELTIRGLGPASTIIDADHNSNIFHGSSSLTIENMTLRDGKTSSDGGAIYMDQADLTVNNVKFIANNARNGGAIANFNSAAAVSNSRFVRNKARFGGAIYFRGSDGQTIADSHFENNSADYGGAIYAYSSGGPGVSVTDSDFNGNSAKRYGGAGYRVRSVSRSLFTNNDAKYGGGGLYSSNAYESVFTENQAGWGGATAYGTVINSTLASNEARTGGGTYATNIYNSTITQNHANLGGGAYRGVIHSSILAGNTDGSGVNDVRYTNTYSSFIGTNRASTLAPTGSGTDSRGNIVGGSTPRDPGTLPLGNYGQDLPFIPLRPDSPAVDGGSNPEFLTIDQNGAARVQGTSADMGAVEGAFDSVIVISTRRSRKAAATLYSRFHTSEKQTARSLLMLRLRTEQHPTRTIPRQLVPCPSQKQDTKRGKCECPSRTMPMKRSARRSTCA